MEEARQSLEEAQADFATYENQTLFLLRVLEVILWIVALTAFLHGVFLIMVRRLAGPTESPTNEVGGPGR